MPPRRKTVIADVKLENRCAVELEKINLSDFFETKKVKSSCTSTGTLTQYIKLEPESENDTGPDPRSSLTEVAPQTPKPALIASVNVSLDKVSQPGSVFVLRDIAGHEYQVMTTGRNIVTRGGDDDNKSPTRTGRRAAKRKRALQEVDSHDEEASDAMMVNVGSKDSTAELISSSPTKTRRKRKVTKLMLDDATGRVLRFTGDHKTKKGANINKPVTKSACQEAGRGDDDNLGSLDHSGDGQAIDEDDETDNLNTLYEADKIEEVEDASSMCCYTPALPKDIIPFNKVSELLSNFEDKLSTEVTIKPNAGQVYLFDEQEKQWEKDGYVWIPQPSLNASIPKIDPTILEKKEFIKSTIFPNGHRGFQRITYRLISRPNIVLVHYKGDNTCACAIQKKRKKRCKDTKKEVLNDDFERPHLDFETVVEYLRNYKGNVSTKSVNMPKGGDVYLFNTKKFMNDNWRVDGYVWRNNGCSAMPRGQPILEKRYYNIRLCNRQNTGSNIFTKAIYSLIERPHIKLVHYMGDHAQARACLDETLANETSFSKKSAFRALAKHNATKKEDKNTNSINYDGDDSLEKDGDKSELEELAEPEFEPPEPSLKLDPKDSMPHDLVVSMLQECSEYFRIPPMKYPKAGEAYLFDLRNTTNGVHLHWQIDGYVWTKIKNTFYYPREKPVFEKKCYYIQHPSYKGGCKHFQRHVYTLVENETMKLIHYIGNEKFAENLSSRVNVKKNYPGKRLVKKVSKTETNVIGLTFTNNQNDLASDKTPTNSSSEMHTPVLTEFSPNRQLGQTNIDPTSDDQDGLSHSPEVNTMELQVLEQQKKNLDLQEYKLKLEIERLEKAIPNVEVKSQQTQNVIAKCKSSKGIICQVKSPTVSPQKVPVSCMDHKRQQVLLTNADVKNSIPSSHLFASTSQSQPQTVQSKMMTEGMHNLQNAKVIIVTTAQNMPTDKRNSNLFTTGHGKPIEAHKLASHR